MNRAEYERIGHRRRGLRRVRGATAWVATGAAALAVMFGGAFAARGLAGAAATGSTGTSSGTGGSTGEDGSASTTRQDDGGGFQPPAQAPGWFSGSSGSHAQSGGS